MMGAGETAQWLRAHTPLPKGPQWAAHSDSCYSSMEMPHLWSPWALIHVCICARAHTQTDLHIIKNFKGKKVYGVSDLQNCGLILKHFLLWHRILGYPSTFLTSFRSCPQYVREPYFVIWILLNKYGVFLDPGGNSGDSLPLKLDVNMSG